MGVICLAATVYVAWRIVRAASRPGRHPSARHPARQHLAPPTEHLPHPTPADLDRLWAMVRDAQGGDVR